MGLNDWLRRRPSDEEMRDELEAHLAMRAAHDGVGEAAARRRLGGVLRTREQMRRVWIPQWIDTLGQDVRFTWRGLRRNPGFTAAAALTLAIAIGANTAIFSVVHGVLLRPLPYPHADRLVRIYSTHPERGGRGSNSIPDYLDWKQRSTLLEIVEGFRRRIAFVDGDPMQRVSVVESTPAFLDLMGARPVLGRVFQAEDIRADAAPVAVLTYELWMSRFGGDPGILGQAVHLGEPTLSLRGGLIETPYTVIGVAGSVRGPLVDALQTSGQVQMFLPWVVETDPGREHRTSWTLTVVARMREGVTLAQVQAELDSIGAAVRDEYPDSHLPVADPLYETTVTRVRPTLLALFGATGLILLIAVSNIANLLLARGSTRRAEIAIRAAVGATRGRLVRLLLTESLVLSMLGGIGGIALAYAALRTLRSLSPVWIPRLQEIDLDGTVLSVSLAVTIASGMLFGLAPALLLRRTLAVTGRRESGAPEIDRGWLRSTLVVIQLALSLVLLTGSGLMTRSVLALQGVPIGIDYRQIVTFGLGPGGSGFMLGRLGPTVAPRLQQYRDALEHVRAIPGVRAATLTSQAPLTGSSGSDDIELLSGMRIGHKQRVDLVGVTEDFFTFFGSRAVAGRLFEPADARRADNVVVVDAEVAKVLWPDERAVGQRVRVFNVDSEVIGVVEPIRYGSLTTEMRPKLFVPFTRSGAVSILGGTVLVRHDGDPEPILAAIDSRLKEIDESLRPFDAQSLEALYDQYLREPRFYLFLLGVLGGLGLAVAAVGVYGVVAYSVARRTGEIGIRLALGARRLHIIGLFCRRTMALVACGVGAGLVGSMWLARDIEGLLFQVESTDPVAIGSMAGLLAATALVATLVPTRRALRIDPAATLRSE